MVAGGGGRGTVPGRGVNSRAAGAGLFLSSGALGLGRGPPSALAVADLPSL